MSKPQVTSRVDPEEKEAVQQLQRDMRMHSESEAARYAIDYALQDLGYLSKGAGLTPARKLARYVRQMLIHVGIVLLFLSVVTPMSYVTPGLGVLFGAVGVAAADHWVLRTIEPAVTNILPVVEVSLR